ncbi:MAG TPA: uroporphyrinogen-III synthase [Candidatus Avirikenella pullistercoris]|nr:uroporphyrinogen-III synthase [Candidatus Avirikenella pullistercoris]
MKINNILISQPAPVSYDKSPFNELIGKYKLKLDFIPFIKVEGVSAKEFRGQRVDILSHSAIIFTSRTTIDNFFRICEETRVTVPEGMKYFCVTEAIALYLQKYIVYRKRKIFFGKGSFADLMDIVIKHKEEKFLVALSEPHKPEIPKALDKARIKYDKVILARTVSADLKERVDISGYDMLVFYSPAEIVSLSANFGDKIPEGIKIAAFGTGTAKAAIAAGFDVSVLAPTKEAPSMAMAIDHFIAKYNKGEKIDTAYIQEYIKETTVMNEQVIAKVKVSCKPKKGVAKTVSKSLAPKKRCAAAATTVKKSVKNTAV